jgi:hypothetical protein
VSDGKTKTPPEQTLKDDSFSPLYICSSGVCFPLNLRVVTGKKYGRAFRKNPEVTQASATPKYPLASLRRADLVKNSISIDFVSRLFLRRTQIL